jgi:hypothetical protein
MKLGGKMSGQYANREQANRFFNEMMGKINNVLLPGMASTGLAAVQFMPDSMEQLLMSVLENSGIFGSMIGGQIGWGSLVAGAAKGLAGAAGGTLGNILGAIPGFSTIGSGLDAILPGHGFNPFDDVEGWPMGDVGGMYTTTGGKGVAGLHPDMRRKMNAMMKANPNIKINSGLRDTHMQRTMKKKGIGTSGGPSAHTRGMAADLGPPSQYNWIVANAKKFGLNSGAHAGEPWHVGMGDLPDIGLGTIGNFFDLAKSFAGLLGATGSNAASKVGQAGGSLMSFIGSLFGVDLNAAEGADTVFNPQAFDQMVTGTHNQAGIFSQGANAGVLDILTGENTSTSSGGGGGGGGGADTSNVALPTGGGPGSREAGIRAATALFNAGFKSRADLEKITAISWRESKWDPTARNANTSDRGLMQINMSANRALMASMGYDEQDLFDIQKNANIAFKVHQGAMGSNPPGGWWPWGFSESSPYVGGGPGWDRNGNPLGRTQGSHASEIVTAANIPGLGDVDGYQITQGTSQRGALIQFNNSFVIGGGAGGAGGGIDARRTAQLIAGHLEDEMSKRMARAS